MFKSKNLLKVFMVCATIMFAYVSMACAENSSGQPEVTILGSSKLDKYANMSPEEFAKNKSEVDKLRADLTAAMNDSDASDSEIAGAQKALERLGEIERQKAAWGGEDDFEYAQEPDVFEPLGNVEESAPQYGAIPDMMPNIPMADTPSAAVEEPDFSAGADESVDASGNNNPVPTVTTKITTNENGKEQTETETSPLGSKGTSSIGGADDSGGNSGTGDSGAVSTSSDTAGGDSQKKDEKKDDTEYSGAYKGHQIIPNLMALHCKVNAEDIVNDISLMEKCVRQYLTEMNNANAGAKQEAMKDYNNLRYATINDALSVAITKAASIAGYEEKMNEYAEATSNADTKFDTEAAVSNTQAFSTDVMNSIRELYVEMIKYEAINGLIDIDPSAIVEDEEQSEKGKYVAEVSNKAEGNSVSAETVIDGGQLPEVTATGSSKLDKYANMSPEEFAKNKSEVDKLRADLTAAMNDSDASDSEIAGAQKALERLGEIERQKAAWGGEDDFEQMQ